VGWAGGGFRGGVLGLGGGPIAPDSTPGYTWIGACRQEVITVPQYLLVLDIDLLALDEQLDLQPINYLAGLQEKEPCEVVVLSLVDSGLRQTPAEFLLALRVGVYPAARSPDPATTAAEHRMNLTVQHLKTIGFKASGIISDEDLLRAVRREARARHYDQVILATGHRDDGWLARAVGPNLIHRLRRQWGDRLIMFQA
jgi:hypothetical protein